MKDGKTNVYNVTLAISNQIVLERSGDGVCVSTVHIDRIREVTELFPAYSLLGFFHSHPYPKADFQKTGCVDPSDTDIEDAICMAVEEGDAMLDLIIGITRLERRSSIVPDFPKPNMIHACCGNYKYTLACSVAAEDEEEKSGRYLPVDNLICTTAAGMVNTDLV
jgi:hypothetical protein